MLIIRSAAIGDLESIYELSQLLVLINLSSDKNNLRKQINCSIDSFRSPSKNLDDNYYLFVLEDTAKSQVVGVSMIHGKHGSNQKPHFYLTVSREDKFSKTINTGFIHGTLKLGIETDGWSEIGGLILHPDYRGNPQKLGKQLSFVRFLYMGLQPDCFTKLIHTELLPPFNSDGTSPLWEAIGRQFMNMDYVSADLLSRENKEFILNLYPTDVIYETLLPLTARNAIGKVGPETIPVKKMLERIGFHYAEEVDPFDGGPHYRAVLSELKPIKNMIQGTLKTCEQPLEEPLQNILISLPQSDNTFKAIQVQAQIIRSQKETIIQIDPQHKDLFNNSFGCKTSAIPL